MAQRPTKIIRTDKWQLSATPLHRDYLSSTVAEYRRMCRYLVTVVQTHWLDLGDLSTKEAVPAVEKLMHQTSKNSNPKYSQFGTAFYKFPSYYRRSAIAFALGQVSSFNTRYYEWQGGIRKDRTSKPPRLNPECGCYPSLYRGQCCKLHGTRSVEIKVFTGTDWIWIDTLVFSVRNRHTISTNKLLSPSLIVNKNSCHLSVPFECKPEKVKGNGLVLAVDQGMNTTATCSVVSFNGTVIQRHFIHPGRDIDHRDKLLKRISSKAQKTARSKGRLHKGFCQNLYRKCRNINKQIGHSVSRQIADLAQEWQVDAIVFEDLKGWKPKGGKHKSILRQRFHGWLKSLIYGLTRDKWAECGGETITVLAAYTSKLAYDGSGRVKRNKKNYALSTFASGKQINCDLNGSYNIAARGILKLIGRNDQQLRLGKSTKRKARSWPVLCDVWNLSSQVRSQH